MDSTQLLGEVLDAVEKAPEILADLQPAILGIEESRSRLAATFSGKPVATALTPKAEAHFSPDLILRARKLFPGDGSLLKALLNNLPAILALLGQFGIGKPAA